MKTTWTSADTLASDHGSKEARADSTFGQGDVVGDCYEIRRLLGSGGMGLVYEAHDRALNRPVAVKVCWPRIAPQWLIREARVMAAFRHPGLPEVYAMGVHKDRPYVVMELLRGRSLATHMEQCGGGLGVDEARNMLMSVASAVRVLHSANLVHRDLKPENIMLVPPDRVVLMDFGITDLKQYVPEHQFIGSPHYIAPESVARQVGEDAAHLLDIYALGVVGFQMLTGAMPFDGPSVPDVLDAALNAEAPCITAWRSTVHPGFAALIRDMLARNPQDRPSSVDEVLARLHALPPGGLESTPDRSVIRVLIADDEPAIWDFMAYVLEDQGFELVCVSSGDLALTEFVRRPFDIVITDKRMPGMDGLELLRRVKARHSSTDVILVSGYNSAETEDQALRDGAAYVLHKPFNIDAIADIVYRLADRRRGHERAQAMAAGA
jgi:serine/threonine-protein kinase